MLLRSINKVHEKIKSDWRWLTLVSYGITATLTTVLHLLRPGEKGVPLDGFLLSMAGIVTSIVVTTFSFVFVALQLASVQFSPRIIRSFFEYDHFGRFFLWSFVACVAYLLALTYFGWSDASLIYPKFGIVGGFYLILLVFPLFVHHMVDNINASSITQNIARRTIEEIETLYEPAEAQIWSAESVLLVAPASGYLDTIRYRKLARMFPTAPDVFMKVRPHIGSFILSGAVLAEIHCPPARRLALEKQLPEFQSCFLISKFRSYEQDIPFGIRQLVDIAIKAISPAINDPTTALNCLDYIGSIVKKAALSDMMSREAKLLLANNIHLREFSFEQLVDLAFDQIYSWGRADYIVVRHLIKTLTNLVYFVPTSEKLGVLIRQIDDMELHYLHADKETFRRLYEAGSPFVRREHRNSLRDHLEEFYTAVVQHIDSMAPNSILSDKKEEYEGYLKELAASRE